MIRTVPMRILMSKLGLNTTLKAPVRANSMEAAHVAQVQQQQQPQQQQVYATAQQQPQPVQAVQPAQEQPAPAPAETGAAPQQGQQGPSFFSNAGAQSGIQQHATPYVRWRDRQ
ncbi:hypothetical protein NLI96_g13010 [Meripilus lineatus]|uniref:Uncharacterized protein n=1 Tax=Meripilus lineatus TaxID=2056292 RepID=A0AAD5UP40_9APHY|nr:hypothetical protein NLI96_g13010 [Physisporinus lineatus]